MIQQLIYRSASGQRRVAAVSAGLSGMELVQRFQALPFLPEALPDGAPVYSRVRIDDDGAMDEAAEAPASAEVPEDESGAEGGTAEPGSGIAIARAASDEAGPFFHLCYVPREDLPAFSRGIPSAEAFAAACPQGKEITPLPPLEPSDWIGAEGRRISFRCFATLFGADTDLLARFLSCLSLLTREDEAPPMKGVCVIAQGEPALVSEAAYAAMETLMRIYPGLWNSALQYRTLWPAYEEGFPVFFTTGEYLADRAATAEAGWMLMDIAAGRCYSSKKAKLRLPPAGEPVVDLARALLNDSHADAHRAVGDIRQAQERAHRAAEAARFEAERRRRIELERDERRRRAEEEARQEAERLRLQREAEEAARLEREKLLAQMKAEEAARQEQERLERERVAREAQRVLAESRARAEALSPDEPTRPEALSPSGDDPILRARRFGVILRSQVFDGGSLQDADFMVNQFCKFLKRHDREYRLAFLETFLTETADAVLPKLEAGQDTGPCEYLMGAACRMAARGWEALFHRATLADIASPAYVTALNCFECLNRLAQREVIDADLRQDLAEWTIARSAFLGEVYEPDNLLERLECLDAMNRRRRADFRQDLAILAIDCAKATSELDTPLGRCGLSACFYAYLRFNGVDLSFNGDEMDFLTDQLHSRALARAYRAKLNHVLRAASDAWAHE